MFCISFLIAVMTFQGAAGFSQTSPIALFVVMYLVNGFMLFVYVIMQIVLVINTLDDRWPLGNFLSLILLLYELY